MGRRLIGTLGRSSQDRRQKGAGSLVFHGRHSSGDILPLLTRKAAFHDGLVIKVNAEGHSVQVT
jgi:hypothetical protein